MDYLKKYTTLIGDKQGNFIVEYGTKVNDPALVLSDKKISLFGRCVQGLNQLMSRFKKQEDFVSEETFLPNEETVEPNSVVRGKESGNTQGTGLSSRSFQSKTSGKISYDTILTPTTTFSVVDAFREDYYRQYGIGSSAVNLLKRHIPKGSIYLTSDQINRLMNSIKDTEITSIRIETPKRRENLFALISASSLLSQDRKELEQSEVGTS